MHIFCSFCSKWHTVFKLFVSLFYQYSTRRQRSCFNHRKMGWGRKIQPMGTLKEVLNFSHFTFLVNVWNNQFELLLVYTYFIINFQIKNKKLRTAFQFPRYLASLCVISSNTRHNLRTISPRTTLKVSKAVLNTRKWIPSLFSFSFTTNKSTALLNTTTIVDAIVAIFPRSSESGPKPLCACWATSSARGGWLSAMENKTIPFSRRTFLTREVSHSLMRQIEESWPITQLERNSLIWGIP